jgi:Tfp pilus assembly protein PilW
MRMNDHGLTVVELLISITFLMVVLGGIYTVFVSANKAFLAQNTLVEMQADTRAAMEFMVRELRLAYGTVTISTTVTANDTISFDRVEETGYSSGGNSSATLNDSRKAWQADEFAPVSTSAYTVRIIAGTGVGQARTIQSNTATQLTVSAAWGTIPDATSLYLITRQKAFTRTSTADNVLRYRIGAGGANQPLAENISAHSFTQPDANTITIALTGRTRALDPRSGEYRHYTITETVRRRNT